MRVPGCQPGLCRHRFSISFARRCTVLEGDERAGIFVAYWWLNSITCHSIKRVKKCIFGDIFHPVAAGTCANSQLDDRLYARCIWRASSGNRAFAAPEGNMRSSSRMWQISASVFAPHNTQRSLGAATCRAATHCVKDAMCRVAAPYPTSVALFCRHQARISSSSRSQSSVCLTGGPSRPP